MTRLAVRGGTAAALLSAALLAGCGGGDDEASLTTYSPEVQKNFVSSCIDQATHASDSAMGSGQAQEICGCMYDELKATMAFEDFRAADKALREGEQLSGNLAKTIQGAAEACT